MYLSDKRATGLRETLARLAEQLDELSDRKSEPRTTDKLLMIQHIYGANHYHKEHSLVLDHAEGVWAWDKNGNKYLDCIATYSAIAVGHGNVELIGAMVNQLFRMTSAPNRFVNDTQPVLLKRICELTGQDKAMLMNTGAEGVDTFTKAVRRWAYQRKGVPKGKAVIISAEGNFHGRTLNAVALSATKKYREGFGPFPPCYKKVPYGNITALEKAITPNTAAVLLEPIQGEGGIIIPPEGYLQAARELCIKRNVLLVFDEIQTGFGRTGKLFGGDWEKVKPDGVILGKALGQYIPVSAFAARDDVIGVFTPNSHGSTFGGTALSCATALKSLELITRDDCALVKNSQRVGAYFLEQLRTLKSPAIKEVRGHGLFIGVEVDGKYVTPGAFCSKLLEKGVLAGIAQQTLRFTPPLVITTEEVDWAITRIADALHELTGSCVCGGTKCGKQESK